MTKTQAVGNNKHHILIPSLKKMAIIIGELNYLSVEFLDEGFVDMVISRCVLGRSPVFEKLRVIILGWECYVPFIRAGGHETPDALIKDGLHLQLIVDDMTDRVGDANEVHYSDLESD